MNRIDSLAADLAMIRERSPLVHNITNYVVMNNTANALLALGASPVMAHAAEEVEEMTAIASALVINIGTLSSGWVESMSLAMRAANRRGRPIVFDPVGAGATRYRDEVCRRLISEGRPAIIRGNGSEILALASHGSATKGVDSTARSADAVEAARALARATGAVVAVSGETDYITDGERLGMVRNGSPLMPRVTGMGCTASAVCGAFAGVNGDALEAAINAMAAMGIAGEIAAAKSAGPGGFQPAFLDALYGLSREQIENILVE